MTSSLKLPMNLMRSTKWESIQLRRITSGSSQPQAALSYAWLSPFSKWLNQTINPEKMQQREQKQLLDFYVSCVQRHLFFHGQDRIFLSKNAAFAGWVGLLAERFPNARFLLCVRHPMSALEFTTQLTLFRQRTICHRSRRETYRKSG